MKIINLLKNLFKPRAKTYKDFIYMTKYKIGFDYLGYLKTPEGREALKNFIEKHCK